MCTHQGWYSEHLYREVSDGKLPVMVVLHVVTLQALIVLPAAAGGGKKRQKRGVCGVEVLTTVGTVKSCTDREVTDTKRS